MRTRRRSTGQAGPRELIPRPGHWRGGYLVAHIKSSRIAGQAGQFGTVELRDGILSRRHQNPADRHYSRQPEERPQRIDGQRCPLHPWSHCDSPANGLIFCVGSYGARPDNDLLAMIDEFAPRIQLAHLRQVVREADGSFHEAEHLRGNSDMVG